MLLCANTWDEPQLQALDPGDWPLPAQGPEPDSVLAVKQNGRIAARCGLWWQDPPHLPTGRAGLIGQYAVSDATASRELLEAAVAILSEQGAQQAIGPIDSSTWHPHRLVVWSRGDPPFPLEPQQPAEWVDYWQAAGFTPWGGYHSSVIPAPTDTQPYITEARRRLEAQGIHIRPIDEQRFDEALRALHTLSLKSFSNNLLFKPLDLNDFLALYAGLKGRHETRASAVAHQGEDILGFVFNYPAPPSGTDAAPRLVIKTLAVDPGCARSGLGSVLLDHAHRRAHELGYGGIIHALMQDDNVSARMRSEQAEIFRRYALFARNCAIRQ